MSRSTFRGYGLCLVTAAVVLMGCDLTIQVPDPGVGGGSGGTGGGSAGTGGGTSGTGGSPMNFALCSSASPCPAGQFCFNGICAVGCQSNGDCAGDQYCQTDGDRLCHNKVVTTCPEVACTTSQVCVSGFCSTPPPPTQCDPNQVLTGNDLCDKNSICFEPMQSGGSQMPKCQSFPACNADKSCPIGTIGAVCNDGLIPNKNFICLTGLCKSAANCPTDWICYKPNANAVVGACSSKGFGSPCNGPSDCNAPTSCQGGGMGFPGFCL